MKIAFYLHALKLHLFFFFFSFIFGKGEGDVTLSQFQSDPRIVDKYIWYNLCAEL